MRQSDSNVKRPGNTAGCNGDGLVVLAMAMVVMMMMMMMMMKMMMMMMMINVPEAYRIRSQNLYTDVDSVKLDIRALPIACTNADVGLRVELPRAHQLQTARIAPGEHVFHNLPISPSQDDCGAVCGDPLLKRTIDRRPSAAPEIPNYVHSRQDQSLRQGQSEPPETYYGCVRI